MKFVHALSLERDVELAKVLAYTMDHVRRNEPAELATVVERMAGKDDAAAAVSQNILTEAGISIQPLEYADLYAQSIRGELGL